MNVQSLFFSTFYYCFLFLLLIDFGFVDSQEATPSVTTGNATENENPAIICSKPPLTADKNFFPPSGGPSKTQPCIFGSCDKWTLTITMNLSNSMNESNFRAVKEFLKYMVNSCDLSRRQIKVTFIAPKLDPTRDWLTTVDEFRGAMNKMYSEDFYFERYDTTFANAAAMMMFAANETKLKARDPYEGRYLLIISDMNLTAEVNAANQLKEFLRQNGIMTKMLLLPRTSGTLNRATESKDIMPISALVNPNSTSIATYDSLNSFPLIQEYSPCHLATPGPLGCGPLLPPDSSPSPTNNTTWIVSASAGLVVILLCIGAVVYFIYSRKKWMRKGKLDNVRVAARRGSHDPARPNDYNELEKRDDWMIPASNLEIFYDQKLGAGAFSVVYKGKLSGPAPVCKIRPSVQSSRSYADCEVAVKVLPIFADQLAKADFIQEINFMKSLEYHPHLVCLLGTVSLKQDDVYLVTEYCSKGDLLQLIKSRKDEILNDYMNTAGLKAKDLISYAWQISSGLDYLSSKGCIHRDVAARNILVDFTNTAKVSDFGLCRFGLTDQSLYMTKGGRLPIKWMSIESLKDYQYTVKSDVWSFGVLLYELFSLGGMPYLRIQPADMVEYLEGGNRLEQPVCCSDEMYSIICQCWLMDPLARPSFDIIRSSISKVLEQASEDYGYLMVDKEESPPLFHDHLNLSSQQSLSSNESDDNSVETKV